MGWHVYWKWLTRGLLGLAVLLGGSIWIIDPYDNLPFAPHLKRWPIAKSQRYSYPSIARDPAFDSAIIGTSTSHMLRPDIFNDFMGGRFVNLSLSNARAYEQYRMFELFARNHPEPRILIVGLDVVWCTIEAELTKYTLQRFPEWMYDDNPWNDVLHLFEFKTIDTIFRKIRFLLGIRNPRHGYDGYYHFLPPATEYDLNRAREHLYGASGPRERKAPAAPPPGIESARASWTYPSHTLLKEILTSLPDKTLKVLFFVPYHHNNLPVPNTLAAARWKECKARITSLAHRYANTVVLDFMIPSPITMRDENYWVVLHYSADVADRLVRLIARGASGKPAPHGEYGVLEPGL